MKEYTVEAPKLISQTGTGYRINPEYDEYLSQVAAGFDDTQLEASLQQQLEEERSILIDKAIVGIPFSFALAMSAIMSFGIKGEKEALFPLLYSWCAYNGITISKAFIFDNEITLTKARNKLQADIKNVLSCEGVIK